MKTRRGFLTTAIGLASILLPASSVGLLHAAPSNVLVVVVSQDSRLREISLRDLRRLYLGENLDGPDGKRIIPLNHNRNATERILFDERILGMGSDEVGRYWIDRKIRGQPGPPRTASPLDRLRAAIRRVQGTLSYLRVGDVQDGMKVLLIDGKAPGDPGYPLTE